jgi:2-C-methyl-D-erythritol 4-phosphate cytidylyltransferase
MTSPVIWAILVAGGSGSRFSQNQSKLLELLHGKPIICRSFEALQQLPEIACMVIVYHLQWQEHYHHCINQLNSQKPVLWVAGGNTRRDSVQSGLDKLPLETDIVLVHDSAR